MDVSCPREEDEKITLELNNASTALKGNVNNNQPKVEVSVQAEGSFLLMY
ncbi:hypothetical protein [Virgibacillus natechei]